MGNNHISEEEAEYRLHIRHIHAAHHARHGNECDSGDRSADHSERDYVPGRFVLSFEERRIRTAFVSGDTGYQ